MSFGEDGGEGDDGQLAAHAEPAAVAGAASGGLVGILGSRVWSAQGGGGP